MRDLGVKSGVPTPIIDAMIVIGGTFHDKNFYKDTKYNLDYLGIGHMTKMNFLITIYNGLNHSLENEQ